MGSGASKVNLEFSSTYITLILCYLWDTDYKSFVCIFIVTYVGYQSDVFSSNYSVIFKLSSLQKTDQVLSHKLSMCGTLREKKNVKYGHLRPTENVPVIS